jgi:hypothetical protein
VKLWTDAERAAVKVPCRHCNAAAGAWCVTVWTHGTPGRAKALHTLRITDAATDGRLPIDVPGGDR